MDLFPVPGSALTGHMDAVEHTIDTGNSSPIRCTSRRMASQKIKQEEAWVEDMLSGGQIEPSDSPWSAPVVLVTKKDGGTRFCVDYRRSRTLTRCRASTILWICWLVRSGFRPWIWLVDIGRSPCHQTLDVRQLLPHTPRTLPV